MNLSNNIRVKSDGSSTQRDGRISRRDVSSTQRDGGVSFEQFMNSLRSRKIVNNIKIKNI